jgi:TonB family protein
MQYTLLNRLSKSSFLLALVLHLLLLLGFITVFVLSPEEPKKTPDMYSIPAYTYNTPPQPLAMPLIQQSLITPPAAASADQPTQSTPPIKHLIYTLPKIKNFSAEKVWGYKPSMMANSRAILRKNQMERVFNRAKDAEPILLVGEHNADANPLVILMARALSKYFAYPQMEGSFGIHGRVLVEIILQPDGKIVDPQIIQSSNNENFDTAALYAVNKAPRIFGANKYVSKAKSYVVGFIFN